MMRAISGTTVVALALTLLLTGCESPGDDAAQPAPTVQDTVDAAPPTAPDKDAGTATPETDPVTDASESPNFEPASGSANASALDKYVQLVQAQEQDLIAASGGAFSSVDIVPVLPDGVEFRYYFIEALDRDDVLGRAPEVEPVLEATAESIQFPEMEAFGIGPSQSVTFTYLNPDGEVLYSVSFRSD